MLEAQGRLVSMPAHHLVQKMRKTALVDPVPSFALRRQHHRNQRPQKPPNQLELTSETPMIRLHILIKLHLFHLMNFVVRRGSEGRQCQTTMIDTPRRHMGAEAPINQVEERVWQQERPEATTTRGM